MCIVSHCTIQYSELRIVHPVQYSSPTNYVLSPLYNTIIYNCVLSLTAQYSIQSYVFPTLYSTVVQQITYCQPCIIQYYELRIVFPCTIQYSELTIVSHCTNQYSELWIVYPFTIQYSNMRSVSPKQSSIPSYAMSSPVQFSIPKYVVTPLYNTIFLIS